MVCKKVRFSDEKQAQFYLDKLKETSIRIKKPVRSYLCPHCLLWHLTSRTEKDNLLIEKYQKKIKIKNEIITNLNNKICELKLRLKGRGV